MYRKIVNIIGPLASIILLLILVMSLIKSVKRIKTGDELVAKNETRLAQINEENRKLQEKLELYQSEEYMERQLRDKLGLAKEGEIVLVLPDNETLKRLSPTIPEEEEIKPKPNWQKWLDLFL